jgi:glycosyltransferase involved in cell wall biosynthesis
MTIGILMPLSSPWSRSIAAELASLGHFVHLIDFENTNTDGSYLLPDDYFQAQSINDLRRKAAHVHLLRSLYRSNVRYITCSFELQRICRDFRIDVLLSLYGGGWALLAYLSGFRPYVVYVVGSDILLARTLYRPINRCTLTNSAAVIANGKHLARQSKSAAPRANTIPLVIGVDTQRFVPCRGLSSDPVRIISTRGFLPIYNHEFLIEGLARLTPHGPNVEVTFTSKGRSLDAVRLIADRTLSPPMRRRVTFLGGVTTEELVASLQLSDVYVSLARSDGTSICLLEALACGLFPILSDIAPNREWIDPSLENGILVPLDDPEALAAALLRATTDSSLRSRAAQTNRRLVLERADIRKNMTVLAERLEATCKH